MEQTMDRILYALSALIGSHSGKPAVVALFALSPLLAALVDPHDYEPAVAFSAEAQERASTNAVERLFGELRTSASDMLFIKTERYLHNGVAYANHAGVEEELQDHDHDCDHRCGASETLIRSPLEDWRGFVGDVQREVKPWLDPSQHMQHTSGTQLLPWYRMVTLINPHRIRGYRIGAMWLLAENDPELLDVALDFINEGVANNPESHELLGMKARILLRKDDLPGALVALRRAVEVGAANRPPEGWSLEGVDRERENALGAAIRTEVFILQRLGRLDEALVRAQQGLRIYGDDEVLRQTADELRAAIAARAPS